MGRYAMIVQEFYLPLYDWNVKTYYVTDRYSKEEIMKSLNELDCENETLEEINDVIDNGQFNVGMTYTNPDKHSSILIIGPTTCADEFQNTFDHEKGHLAMHISMTLNIEPFSEDFEYLTGTIGMKLFSVAKMFMCDTCRKRWDN